MHDKDKTKEQLINDLNEMRHRISKIESLYDEYNDTRNKLHKSEDMCHRLIETANDAIFIADAETGIITNINKKACNLLDMSENEIRGMHLSELHPHEESERYREIFRKLIQEGKAITESLYVVNSTGTRIPVEISANVLDFEGRKIIQGIFRDITERKRASFSDERNAEILEMIATGQPPSIIFDAIALMYEARHPGMRCSLLELRGNKLMHGGAPSLPKEYCEAVNGLEYGPCVGSCGTSTYTGKRVLVEDIATDPKWAALKDVALPHGLRSCWSEPIKNAEGKVLGAFGMYYNHPALPNENELRDLKSGARLTGIIMELKQAEEKLKRSEKLLKEAQRIGKLGSLNWNISTNELILSDEALEIYGLDKEKKKYTLEEITKLLHPDDRKEVEISLQDAIAGRAKHDMEHRMVRPDRKVIYIKATAELLRDSDGKPVSALGTIHDITERKEKEAEVKIVLKELENFYQMSMSREHKMIELKGEIEKLKSELSQYKK
jgi:PAS domain S-box-containing protein